MVKSLALSPPTAASDAASTDARLDVLIVGSGTSGATLAARLTEGGLRVAMLEAGKFHTRDTFPHKQVDAPSQLFWSGGIELNTDADIGLLRPKCVGGGSVVNQALLDRFDDEALDAWRKASGVPFFTRDEMARHYERVERDLALQVLPEKVRNRNADIFTKGLEAQGHGWKPLRRAERDCRHEDDNDCILCLDGCRLDSKQSMPVTFLKQAIDRGLVLFPETEATHVVETRRRAHVLARDAAGRPVKLSAPRVVLASGAIGNSKLLLRSGAKKALPAVGEGFYCHPQVMVMGLYDEPVDAHRGAFQTVASDEPAFRRQGFKLENVFAPPTSIAMLLPGYGREHAALMERYRHMACIEVAIRDTIPGSISLGEKDSAVVKKPVTGEDAARVERGLAAIRGIFAATGAKDVVVGRPTIGLHLMGGCAIGVDRRASVVGPDFRLHGHARLYAADSSIFPNAPGINPALTIMALATRAAQTILEEKA